MRKIITTIIIILVVGILSLIGYYNIQTKKQWEVPKKETLKTSQIKTDVTASSKEDKKTNAVTSFKRPERCKELMENWTKTRTNKDDLWNICKIPVVGTPLDLVSVIKWWKDEYGYEDLMYENIKDLSEFIKYPGMKLTGVIEPLKNIAVNSKFPQLRERAVIALHEIDREKSIPILKEVLRKEVEEREVTKEGRQYPIIWAGRFLSEEGEYEYAFPYLMKAKVFEMAYKKKDEKVVPFARKALNDKDEGVRLDAALSLVRIGSKADNEKIIAVTTAILKTSKDGGYRDYAIYVLGELGDKNALPTLKAQLKVLDPQKDYKYESVLKAIRKIEESTEKKGEGYE